MRVDRARLLDWLRAAPVTENGAVLSWRNDRHPGYPYPEAAGLWLRVMADPARRVVDRLARDVGASGGVGRDGIEYAFDTAMAIAGLRAAGAPVPPAMTGFLARCVAQRVACTRPDTRWSRRWGCHLLKIAVAAPVLIAPVADELAVGLPDEAYTHAWCYGVEGLLVLGRDVRGHAAWLAGAQHDSGGLRAYRDGSGPLRADATAQAVRLWVCADRDRYAGPIDRAFSFLAGLQHSAGGIRYESDSDDINTWASLFTLQAIDWACDGGRPACLA